MAVLKDLIVHGPSRFLNGINVDAVHANLIDADNGVFKTITTTTLDAETITTDMLNATNARVSQTLTVDGTISTNKWEAANIANIGGNFYISPTGKADSGTITITKTGSTTINGIAVGVYTLVVGSASFGVTSTNSTIWGPTSNNQSKVIFTGSIAYSNSKKYPLGTCNGTMTALSVGTNTLTGFTITGVNSPALDIFFKEVGVTSISNIACSGYEMQISVYQSYSNSALRPIGILLTSYGKEKRQYIDIYNGENQLGDSNTGFADPAVRIGLLDGLPNIVTNGGSDTLPGGWGIYTTNGFFKGKIVANAGTIANFTINGSKLYSNNHSAYNTATTGIYIGDDYISFGNGGVTYFNTSGTGKVGPWVLTTTALYNSKSSYNNSNAGIYIGTDYIAGGAGDNWWIKSDGKFQFGGANGVTYNGTTLTVPAANVSGALTAATIDASKINAGNIAAERMQTNLISAVNAVVSDLSALTATIGGFAIDSSSIHTNGVAVTSNADNSIALSSADFTRTINSISRGGLRFAIGDKFGVTGDGVIYASSADISGSIEATSFTAKSYSGSTLQRTMTLTTDGITLTNNVTGKTLASIGSTITLGDSTVSTSYNTFIDSSGILMRKGTIQLAKYGDTITIGKDNAQHIDLSSNAFEMKDSSQTSFFKIRDAVNESGQVVDTFSGNGSTTSFTLSYTASSTSYTVTKNGTTVTPTKTTTKITFSTAPADGDIIVVTYNVSGNSAKGYDIGIRKSNTITGAYSVAEGLNTTASGRESHAGGYNSIASGPCDFAFGDNVQTGSSAYSQIVFGDYNEPGNYIFAIGNGDSEERSNALSVYYDYTYVQGDFKVADDIIPVYHNSSSSNSIGYLKSSNGSTTLASGTGKEVATIDLTRGSWIIMYGAQFGSNSSGYREMWLKQGTSDINGAHICVMSSMTSTNVQLSGACPIRINDDTITIRVAAKQNSGSNLNCSAYLRAMRIN